MRTPRLLPALLLLPGLAAACPPAEAPRERLQAWSAARWQVADASLRQRVAGQLLDCLGDPDPVLRDDLAFGGLSAWMRAGALDTDTVRHIGVRVLQRLAAPDAEGLATSFAALTLAEVARVDRLQPFWTADERDAVLTAAARYLQALRDYRGFDPVVGWRHGVAHGADLLMQLSLNPRLDRAQLDRIRDAVQAQVAPSAHAYVFGEGERLARPVLFIARRGLHDPADWSAWLLRIARATRATGDGPQEQAAAIVRRHNTTAWLQALYVAVQEGQDTALRSRLLPGLSAALQALD